MNLEKWLLWIKRKRQALLNWALTSAVFLLEALLARLQWINSY